MKTFKLKGRRRGFSLLELLIAMVVLAIGIMATMAMQFIALAGYSASRDGSVAADVGRAIEQRLKAEALEWNPLAGGTVTTIAPIYVSEGVSSDKSLLALVDESNWSWQRVFSRPVDARLMAAGSQRYCAYVSGGRLTFNSEVRDAYRVQIAVVYPASRGTFPDVDADNPQGQCPAFGNDDLDPSDPVALELEGLRASYFGTLVRAPTR